jgi:carboxyl-terminal processing protease
MKHSGKIIAFLFPAFALNASAQSADFETVKNLDIFIATVNELQNEYVDSLSMGQLVNYALEGITGSLDPYTEYVPAEQQKDFDFQTTGRYAGIGSLIRRDSTGIIIAGPYRSFPADEHGLVAGDRIIEIDGQSVRDFTVERASNMLRGEANTKVKVKVEKLRTGALETISITRRNIRLPSVTASGMTPDGIGYIRINSFISDGCGTEVRNALKELRASGELKSLVIDLRGNRGGLLKEAVRVVNLFVPKGITVVTSAGYKSSSRYEYRTAEEPLEPSLPIAVLVDNYSASAAEIVSGAIQDLDRGIIVGTHTYGKGYVQTIRDVGYDARIKFTTAKYYIPSGRCIQAHNFTTRNSSGGIAFIPDSLKKEFKTKNGRIVFDGGGVTPDVPATPEEYSPIAISLLSKNIIFDYSLLYYKKHLSIATPDRFDFSDTDYDGFIEYLDGKEYDYKTASEQLMNRLMATVKQERYYDNVKNELDKLNDGLKHDKMKDLRINKTELKALIREEIAERYYYEDGRIKTALRRDRQFDQAREVLLNEIKYGNLLTVAAKEL